MKRVTLFLFLFLTQLAFGLEPYQGSEVSVDSWRCGAPLVENLRQADPEGKLQNSGINAGLKASLESISQSNIDNFKKKLGALSSEEQQLVDLIENKYQVPIVHRTELHVAKTLLSGGVDLSSPTKRRQPPRVTPGIEQSLFSGWDCIYASVAPPYGIQQYGSVLVRLKNDSNFSWGSIYTGFSWTREVIGRSLLLPATDSMKQEFAKQVYTNNHYNEAIALHIIDHIRNGTSIRSKGAPYNKSSILGDLLQIPRADWFWNKVVRHRLGFLEAHYTDDIGIQDIEFIQFRTLDMPTVNSWNLPANWFGTGQHSGLIQHFNRPY